MLPGYLWHCLDKVRLQQGVLGCLGMEGPWPHCALEICSFPECHEFSCSGAWGMGLPTAEEHGEGGEVDGKRG